jgi:RHS repeat-associated protein
VSREALAAPDGASTTTYVYQGNHITVTNPAGAWKTFTTDALGNLVEVTELNPAGSGYYITGYSYDILGHVLSVSMPRPTGTQTRSFTYSGNYLTSATNPENGTVNYTYNSYYKVATRTDAKNQQVQYTYDSYARLTEVQRGTLQNGNFTADACQQESYYYDSNPFNSSYSQNVLGRLAAVQYYGGEGAQHGGLGSCDTTYQELYSYSSAGGVVGKELQLTRNFPTGPPGEQTQTQATVSLAATFGYDNEGRMTSEQYPAWGNGGTYSGPKMAFTYDSMGRPYTAEDQNNNNYGVTSAAYTAAGQLQSMAGTYGGYGGQSFTYNAMLQLTQVTAPGINVEYNYSSNQNNGKIISQVDMISGEQVNFTYDALNRLASAATSSNPSVTQWGQSFTYDGFGNLTNVSVTQGSAPTYSANYNAATNQQTGDCADANGNLNAVGGPCGNAANDWYDVENRVLTPNYNSPVVGSGGSTDTWYYYSYAPGNKRVWRGSWEQTAYDCQIGGNCQYEWSRPTDIVAFWAPNGQKLAEYSLTSTYGSDYDCDPQDPIFYATQTGTYYYFGGRMIKNENGWVYPDRLGSIGKFYPYGTERPSATTNGTEKFTGYFRDAETGNDYADQRYHLPGQGRFMAPDRAGLSAASPANPSSWNLYSYVGGDPVNRTDPRGMNDDGSDGCGPGFLWDPDSEQCVPCPPWGGGTPAGGGGGQGPGQSGGVPCQLQVVEDTIFDRATQIGNQFGNLDSILINDFSVSSFLSTVAGQPTSTGAIATQTELVLTANSVADFNALASFLNNSGLFSSWPSNPLVGPPHSGYTDNYRQNVLIDSMQIETNPNAGQYGQITIDIDPFNPAKYYGVGATLHGLLQVLPNSYLSPKDTNYAALANKWGFNVPKCPQ